MRDVEKKIRDGGEDLTVSGGEDLTVSGTEDDLLFFVL